MRCGKQYQTLKNLDYTAKDGEKIECVSSAKDLGITMSEDMNFDMHNNKLYNACKSKSAYILRTFKTRDPKILIPLWKSLVMSKIEYCSILTNPFRQEMIKKPENLQRSFTSKLNINPQYDYYDRLKDLNLFSLQRRRERYAIIYTWKILEGMVPNLPQNKIQANLHVSYNGTYRNGRMCKIPNIVKNSASEKFKTLFNNSLAIRGPRLFNSTPHFIRNITGVSVSVFKNKLDKWLLTLEDKPPTIGYAVGNTTNSLIEAWKIGKKSGRA